MIEDRSRATPATMWAPPGDERPLVYVTFGTIVGTSPALRGVFIARPWKRSRACRSARYSPAGAGLALPGADAGILGAAVARVLAVADFGRAARRIADEIAAMPPIEAAVAAMVAMASDQRKSWS